MPRRKEKPVKDIIAKLMEPMTTERVFGEVMTKMGLPSTSREGTNWRRGIEKKRAGKLGATPADVLALMCMQEVAAGRLRLEDYEEQIDSLLPPATDYRDERVHRWALAYVLHKIR